MNHKHLGIGILVSLLSWGSVACMNMFGKPDLFARVMTTTSASRVPWRVFTAMEIENGVSAPTNTNIVFTMPNAVSPLGVITRESLLGGRGLTTRYWGYCLPQGQPNVISRNGTLPGQIFLSEAERAARLKKWRDQLPKFSLNNLPLTPEEAAKQEAPLPKGVIRHQIETFGPGDICYLMVGGSKPLMIGTDLDGDGLNSSLERGSGTDSENADSDADGITDGVEVLVSFTNPLQPDSDGDGLSDGMEDANHNGVANEGETDPGSEDSDHDGLCDGLCQFGRAIPLCPVDNSAECGYTNKAWLAGEDKNLNGVVDDGETDPRLVYSDGYVNDYQKYLNCRLAGATDC